MKLNLKSSKSELLISLFKLSNSSKLLWYLKSWLKTFIYYSTLRLCINSLTLCWFTSWMYHLVYAISKKDALNCIIPCFSSYKEAASGSQCWWTMSVCLLCSVLGGCSEVLQLRVYFHLRHRGPAQTRGIWHTQVLQRQVIVFTECTQWYCCTATFIVCILIKIKECVWDADMSYQ